MRRTPCLGLTLVDTAVATAAIVIVVAVTIPVVAGGGTNAGIQQSMSNLATLGLAHVIYAADWNGRQVTWFRDDLGAYEDHSDYNDANGCPGGSGPFDPACHPHIIAGWGETEGGSVVMWAWWSHLNNASMITPINFPDGPYGGGITGLGIFRAPHPRPFHEYVTGRYHDPIFWAPNDELVLGQVEPCLDSQCEFEPVPQVCNPGYSSYCNSPAAMFHPDVMRANADGGWQNPWGLAHGFESPGFFQAPYPNLKTLMIEHSWVQNPPAGPCNPAFTGCEPYYFNHGIDSSPVTLFYDLHVRLLPNSEVLAADFQVLAQTGNVDGLWHRGTPFGANGYFIDASFDFVPLSHHVLTTDGILGRDTLGGPLLERAPQGWTRPPRQMVSNVRELPSVPLTGSDP